MKKEKQNQALLHYLKYAVFNKNYQSYKKVVNRICLCMGLEVGLNKQTEPQRIYYKYLQKIERNYVTRTKENIMTMIWQVEQINKKIETIIKKQIEILKLKKYSNF